MPSDFGTVLIHASLSLATGWRNDPVILAALAGLGLSADDVATMLPRGAIIGKAEVVEVIDPEDSKAHDGLSLVDRHLCSSDGYTNGLCLWKLSKPKQFSTPVPCKGSLNIWTVPDDVIRKLLKNNKL